MDDQGKNFRPSVFISENFNFLSHEYQDENDSHCDNEADFSNQNMGGPSNFDGKAYK
jgi:hypothetical protein